MTLSEQTARHFREVFFGGNLTAVNLRDTLADVTWQEATTQVYECNTIATLLGHISYYVHIILKVLEGGPLVGSDKLSFDYHPVRSQEDWEELQEKTWREAEEFARLVAEFPESRLKDGFDDGKYGTWFRNLHGLIEHTHYHLGQIVVIRKMLVGERKSRV